ncbi:hypothetical protein ABK040_013024 [Willaertia magna]
MNDHIHLDPNDSQPIATTTTDTKSLKYISWFVYSFTLLFVLALLSIVILYSINLTKDINSIDTQYTSTELSFPNRNLKIQKFSAGKRRKVLFHYIFQNDNDSNDSDSNENNRKPEKGQLKLNLDNFGNTIPTLLFLNPFPESCKNAYDLTIKELIFDFKITCINTRGFGESETINFNNKNIQNNYKNNYKNINLDNFKNDTLFSNLVNDLKLIIEKEEPKGNLILIGQDLSGLIIYLLIHQVSKDWLNNYLKGVITINSIHPNLFIKVFNENNLQKEKIKNLFKKDATINDWIKIYYNSLNNNTNIDNIINNEWEYKNRFNDYIQNYIKSNFEITTMTSDNHHTNNSNELIVSFPTTNVATNYKDNFEDKLLIIYSKDHPFYLFPENVKNLENVLKKEVLGGIWYVKNNPMEFAEIVRNFVFTVVMDWEVKR